MIHDCPSAQESTERQYALREKALGLGWSDGAIRILDRDLGKTGTQMAGREDFKTLVADVSMGQVGAVFALEVSRLARSNLDWHRLLELCAFTATLISRRISIPKYSTAPRSRSSTTPRCRPRLRKSVPG